MKATRFITAKWVLLTAVVGCAGSSGGAPAAAPAEAATTGATAQPSVGQAEAQAREIEPPAGAALTSTTDVTFGTERVYTSPLTYAQAVGFFDQTLAKEGCESLRRTTTKTSTVWTVQCRQGDRVHVAVRSTLPTTVEILQPAAPPGP